MLGFLQQLLGNVAVLREQSDANRGAQADFLLIEGEWRFKVIENILCQFGSLVRLFYIGLNQCELIAAQARKGTERPL